MKQTWDAMRRSLSRAVVELRTRMRWDQQDLANAIAKCGARIGITVRPNQVCISRWEHSDVLPSRQHRAVLARIAAGRKETADLATYFRAPERARRPAVAVNRLTMDNSNGQKEKR